MDLHPGEEIVFEGHPSWRSMLSLLRHGPHRRGRHRHRRGARSPRPDDRRDRLPRALRPRRARRLRPAHLDALHDHHPAPAHRARPALQARPADAHRPRAERQHRARPSSRASCASARSTSTPPAPTTATSPSPASATRTRSSRPSTAPSARPRPWACAPTACDGERRRRRAPAGHGRLAARWCALLRRRRPALRGLPRRRVGPSGAPTSAACSSGSRSRPSSPGLSWLTILRKREAFRAAFAGFEPDAVARFGAGDVERLLGDAGDRAQPGQDRGDDRQRARHRRPARRGHAARRARVVRTARAARPAPASFADVPAQIPEAGGAGQGAQARAAFASSDRPRSTPGCRPAGWSTTTSRRVRCASASRRFRPPFRADQRRISPCKIGFFGVRGGGRK